MMITKSLIYFEKIIDDRTYRFEMPHNANLGEIYMVCSEVLDEIAKIIKENAEARKPKEPEVPEQTES